MSENKILRDLANGQNLSETLPKYADILAKGYTRLSYCKLGTNYITYYDDLEKASGLYSEKTVDQFNRFSEMLEHYLEEYVNCLEDAKSLREELITSMKEKFDYVRMLGIYEHVMNRIQYRFEENLKPVNLDILMNEISAYIHRDEDPQGMNDRIQNVFGEMPVRITKSKFLDNVETACSYYMNTRSDIADHFFKEMNQQAVILKADDLNPSYSDLYEIAHDLEAIDLKNITNDEMEKSLDKLQIAGQQLSASFSYDFELLELLNDFILILINDREEFKNEECIRISSNMIASYRKAAKNKDFIGMDENIIEDMTKLSDANQNMTGLHMLFEDQLSGIVSRYAEQISHAGLNTVFDRLRVSNLLSGIDLMVDIEKLSEITIADASYIKNKTEELIAAYKSMFEKESMMIRRAVICDAFTKLPIVFNSTEDVEKFIRQNFENCKDESEIFASAFLIRQIMNDREWA